MKNILKGLVLCVFTFCLLTGCGNEIVRVEGNLVDLMSNVYANISEEELPMMLESRTLADDEIEYFIGTKDIKYKEVVASESGIGSIAHSVVLIRMQEDATEEDIENAKKLIKEKADPRKWMCVEAENVFVESNGDLILLVMSDAKANTIKDNFLNLK